ncbi:MAG TPA: ATP-binding cassette domain-containing protein [Candidatus Coprovivens excrementavium]|nr:ATP-binding cassette domain-containing protein [Candidatus Coprovivens excrementavium]
MNKRLIVKQQDIRDCGICCLESIIKYYNGYIPLERLRLDTKTGTNGTTALNLIKTAQKYGFNALGRKDLTLDSEELLLPAIAHTITPKGLNHFVVIYKKDSKYVSIMDPAKGYIKLSREEFQNNWTNIILIFKPFKQIPLYKIKNNLKELFIKIIIQEQSLIRQIIISSIILTILSIIISYYFKIVITSIETNYINTTYFIIGIFLILHIFKLYFTHFRNTLAIYLNKNIDISIIPDFISHIFNLPLNVINSRTSGEILTRIRELSNIKELFSEIFITIILDLILCLSCSYLLYNINSKLFFILCIISIFYIITGLSLNPTIISSINDNIDLETEFNSSLSEEISSLESIKNLNLTSLKIDDLTNSYVNYQESSFTYYQRLNMIETIKKSINEIGLFIITSYGVYLIYQNQLNILSLITFNTLLTYFIEPISNTLNLLPRFNFIKLSIIKIGEFLNLSPEKLGHQESLIPGDIQFKNITYSYDNFHQILQNITLNIKQNSHNIIVGSTGSGKTTLMKMLNLNISDYKGKITINDINIKDYSLKTLRNSIIYISQREKLFTDTILNNLTLYQDISPFELKNVLNITKVNEIIDKKALRLESIIYNEGYNLSGGERQRLILARSLLKHPQILIMDESLSEVDKKTETEILKSLDKYLPNTTIIYISHTNSKCFSNIIKLESQNDKKIITP